MADLRLDYLHEAKSLFGDYLEITDYNQVSTALNEVIAVSLLSIAESLVAISRKEEARP